MDISRYLYLSQTDTTIGFVSQDSYKIDRAKRRLENKYYIKAVKSLSTLKGFTRVPQKYKNLVRRAKKTTFIIKCSSFRVIKDSPHNLLLDRVDWLYTSSANLSGSSYNGEYVINQAEVIIYPLKFSNSKPSKIFRLGINSIKRVR